MPATLRRVRVRVPASTANLGPGFDCLGLALGLYNTFDIALRDDDRVQVTVSGEGAGELDTGRSNLIVRAIDAVWRSAGEAPRGLDVHAANAIPTGSGLGSSASAAVGGIAAANALLGDPLSRLEMLALAHSLEGHPDNAAAALYGSLTLVSAAVGDLLVVRVEVPVLHVAIALPDVRLSTHDARKALPAQVRSVMPVFNVGRALLVVQALQHGDYALLGRAMADRLHEPYRLPLLPGCAGAMAAARAAGAAAVALSGAGPSVAAFAAEGHAAMAEAMRAHFEAQGIACRVFVLAVDREGVNVEPRSAEG